MTGERSARSAGLLVGSTPASTVKVHSAGQTLGRLLANRRCQRVRVLFGPCLRLEPPQPILVLLNPGR